MLLQLVNARRIDRLQERYLDFDPENDEIQANTAEEE